MMGRTFLVLLFLWTATAHAQESKHSAAPVSPDTLRTTKGGAQTPQKNGDESSKRTGKSDGAPGKKELTAGEEYELEAIAIQAVVEKPNVDIIPRRTKPDFEEVRFTERSFERELKEIPKELLLLDEELERAQKLDELKKNLPPPKP